ncbi:MAG: acyl-CoA dehydrogenase family protein [Thalassobaculum sp.]|uniref:acyl-CoA dehydrogenase family protein n=1 Tax=Thalassobaculum sp. TaxID=2022740 RepID=UPI0032EB4719
MNIQHPTPQRPTPQHPDPGAPDPGAPDLADQVAPDCHGLDFFALDRGLQDLLTLYLPDDLRRHLLPHLERLGRIAGDELDDWARLADRHGPVLHPRDARGRFEDRLEFHPAYREMERVGFGEFGLACMIHKPGVLGWPEPLPHLVKFVCQYLFGQSEFGQLCPISATETSATMIKRYGSPELQARFLERMLSQDMGRILKGAQFMTERTGGSDVGNIELQARREGGGWRLYGEKWFCSCADADIAILLARPEGAVAGSRGLGLFAMPRTLDDGSRNRYRIVRLKNKLGSRSMASGEIVFDGAVAYPLGRARDEDDGSGEYGGLKMMMDQVALSRLSHGVRAASMMRRCMNEALVVARGRSAFGGRLIDKPLLRRQLMKLMVPTEQALSMAMYLGQRITAAEAGDARASRLIRILTPVFKYRSARDNVRVATGAMEVRGGNGYIEDFVNARLVRDAHLGVLWEGTSNINSLDVITRAVGKVGAHADLEDSLRQTLEHAPVPGQFKGQLQALVQRAVALADEIARSGDETLARKGSSALYHATTATLLASEGALLGAAGGDARRLLLARMVVDHRLTPSDPLWARAPAADDAATDLLLGDAPVPLSAAADLLAA